MKEGREERWWAGEVWGGGVHGGGRREGKGRRGQERVTSGGLKKLLTKR